MVETNDLPVLVQSGCILWDDLQRIYPGITLDTVVDMFQDCDDPDDSGMKITATFCPGQFIQPKSEILTRRPQIFDVPTRCDGVRTTQKLLKNTVLGFYCGTVHKKDTNEDSTQNDCLYGLDLVGDWFVDATRFADVTGPHTVNDGGDPNCSTDFVWFKVAFLREQEKETKRAHPLLQVPLLVQRTTKTVPVSSFLSMDYGEAYWKGKTKNDLPKMPVASFSSEEFRALMLARITPPKKPVRTSGGVTKRRTPAGKKSKAPARPGKKSKAPARPAAKKTKETTGPAAPHGPNRPIPQKTLPRPNLQTRFNKG